MSVQVLYQADILLDGIAATTDMNRVKFNINQQVKEVTAFGDVARHSLPGVYEASVDGDFYYQSGLNMLVNLLEAEFPGGASAGLPLFSPTVITVSDVPTVGGLTHILQGADASAEHTGAHGEVLKGAFKFQGAITGRAVQGSRLMRGFNTGTSGLGTAINLGAVGATQAVYAALHILGTTGTGSGAVLSIISSASSGMPAPTTRLTFTSGTSSGRVGEWQQTAVGAITDTWWAAKWVTFAGASGFTASISAGIQ